MPFVPAPVTRGPKWLQRMFAERDAYDQQMKIIPGSPGVTIHETEAGTVVNLAIALIRIYSFGPSFGGGFGDSTPFNDSVIKKADFIADGNCTFLIRKGLDEIGFGGETTVGVNNTTRKLKADTPLEMHGGETLSIEITCDPPLAGWDVILYGTGTPAN